MNVILESSGALRACLLMIRNDATFIIASKEKDKDAVIYNRNTNTDKIKENLYSKSIVSYAINTARPAVIDDAANNSIFNKDSYILCNNVKSAMCLPIYLYEKLTGILYIENNLTSSAFSERLVEVLERLAVQAISTVKPDSLIKKKEKQETGNRITGDAAKLLNEKETEILLLMESGLPNFEIAEKLFISEGTVKWYSNRIFKKLGVRNRTQAVVKAKKIGLM